jgi:pimeloyl-ACP methyl ester carboxylesterase
MTKLILLLLSLLSLHSVAKELPVFIVAGQSNAFRLGGVGAPAITQGPSLWYYANPKCVQADALNAKLMRLNMNKTKGHGQGIASSLAKIHPDGFAIIRYAICGSNLHTQWMPTEPDGYYNKYFKPFVAAGLKKITQQSGRKPEVKAIFWHQGESNSNSDKTVALWAELMPVLIEDSQNTYGNIPFIMGEIRGFDGKKPLRALINKLMHEVAKANPLAAAVELQDVTWQTPTNVHFGTAGAKVAGERMVKAWQKLAAAPSQQGGKKAPTKSTDWNGHDKQSFKAFGHDAFVVVPQKTAPGKPWIWRTSFPNYHAGVDQKLADHGFHIAYINVVKMLGADPSLDIMENFYTYVRTHWGLAEKPALEPCSRGGLHAYRYAARHPDQIACIYGDVPVMDLKSWPFGRNGEAKGVQQDALKYYKFKSRDEVMSYKGNPIDLLKPIADAKIPLRHVICLTDKVVPPEENTLEAQLRLRKMGHDIELVIVKDSKKAHGHHFPMIETDQSVQFIIKHCTSK